MQTHEIRTATAEDVDAIRTLTREAYARWVPVIGREPLPMVADYGLAVRLHRIDLLHEGGTLTALIETIARDDHLFIENLAVSPACQGQGLGRTLLRHAERMAADLGRPEIRLLTNKAFGSNVRFYERSGFRIDREEPFRGGTTVHMSKSL